MGELYDLYQDAAFYDRLHARFTADLPFWLAMAERCGGPTLELACGTGRVTLPLAGAGHALTGLDNAPDMLALARQKADEAGLAVEFLPGDMRTFDLGRQFALILLPFNTICHLLTIADLLACFASIQRHLAPGGCFVLDVFVPDPAYLIESGGEPRLLENFSELPDGRVVTVTENYTYGLITQIKRTEMTYHIPGEGEQVRTIEMRMLFPQELDALLQWGGFAIEEKYGSYDLAPFGEGAAKQLIVCKQGEHSK